MSEEKVRNGVTRRGFLKTSAIAAGAAVACSPLTALAESKPAAGSGEKVYHGVCRANCMAACRFYGTVRDGKLVNIVPAEYQTELYTGTCLKGLSYQNRIYSANRVTKPLRRVQGTERGAGQWEVITWDEAISEVSSKLKSIMETYGGASVLLEGSTGNYGEVYGAQGIWNRIGAQFGWSKAAGMNDLSTGYGIDRVLGTGLMYYANETTDVFNAQYAFVWGSNPVHACPQNWRVTQRAQENGTRVICIDPVRTATAMKADEFIPIYPTTDGYLALAMVNYIIQNKLWDNDFVMNRSNACYLVRRDTGMFLRQKDIDGSEDNTALVWDEETGAAIPWEAGKGTLEGTFDVDGITVDTVFTLLKKRAAEYTVDAASSYCHVPKETIMHLIDIFVNARGIVCDTSFGMDHYVNGYQTNWAIAILFALTGHVGSQGNGFYGIYLNTNVSMNYAAFWVAPGYKGFGGGFPATDVPEIAKTQTFNGKPYPLKALIYFIANSLSNWPDQNSFINDILPAMELVVCCEMEMTDSARYSDYVLPIASYWEVEEFRKCHNIPSLTHQEQAIDPVGEAKGDLEIVKLLAKALGVDHAVPENYTFDDAANALLSGPTAAAAGVSLERLRKEGYVAVSPHPERPMVIGETGFATENGLARFYTEAPAPRTVYGQAYEQDIPRERLVYFQPSDEVDENSAAAKKFPIVFYQEHTRWRTHSQWFESPILRELDPEPLFKISRADAEARGIKDMDTVEVFNDRGHMVLRCIIDDALPAGVSRVPKGWQRHQFIEGGYQELTNRTISTWAVAFGFYDTRVDVRKWEA